MYFYGIKTAIEETFKGGYMKDDKIKLEFSYKMKLLFLKEDIKQFFVFLKWLPSYFKLHNNYKKRIDFQWQL